MLLRELYLKSLIFEFGFVFVSVFKGWIFGMRDSCREKRKKGGEDEEEP